MDYPFTKCLNPRMIVNPYTGEQLEVSCGVCKACLMNRANKMSFMCSLEESEHKYTMFFTLTYKPVYAPIAVPFIDNEKGIVKYISQCNRLGDIGQVICIDYNPCHCSPGYQALLQDKVHLPNGITYTSVRDIQLFMKRLRKNLTKYTDEKIRYYIVSEYGPKTFRAHYHGMLFFDKKETLESMPEALPASWPFGNINYSLSRGKCSSYVARYINSNSFIPPFLACGSSKPFSVHSRFFAQGFYRSKKKEVYEDAPDRFVRTSRAVGGKFVEFMPWRSLACTFYPKCRSFSRKSFSELLESYTILLRAQQACSIPLEEIKFTNFCKHVTTVAFSYLNITDNGSVWRSKYINDNTRELALHFIHDYGQKPFIAAMDNKDNYDRLINMMLSDFYVSKHFLTFCCDHQTTYEYRRKVACIVEYWQSRDYENLRHWYNMMDEYAKEYPSESLAYFYNNVPRDKPVTSTKVYKNFVIDVDLQAQKAIKHKRQNDANLIFINL